MIIGTNNDSEILANKDIYRHTGHKVCHIYKSCMVQYQFLLSFAKVLICCKPQWPLHDFIVSLFKPAGANIINHKCFCLISVAVDSHLFQKISKKVACVLDVETLWMHGLEGLCSVWQDWQDWPFKFNLRGNWQNCGIRWIRSNITSLGFASYVMNMGNMVIHMFSKYCSQSDCVGLLQREITQWYNIDGGSSKTPRPQISCTVQYKRKYPVFSFASIALL